MGPMGRIKHDVIFRRSSPGGGTSWTSDNNSVWLSSSECSTDGWRSLLSTIALSVDVLVQDPFFVVETACVAWFSVEFLLRLVACPSKRQFVLDVMNVFDVLAIVPYFVVLAPAVLRLLAPYLDVFGPYFVMFPPFVVPSRRTSS